jgi:hypothetical protein
MTKCTLISVAVLTLSTSAALAATHPTHHRNAMNAYARVGAPPPPAVGTASASSSTHTKYMQNLHDSGYDPKNDFTKAGTMRDK